MRSRAYGFQSAVLGADAGGVRAVIRAAGEQQPRYRSDAGQPLSAKTHAGHPFQIAQAGDFAGGVPRQRQRQILGMDAAAIVAHPNQLDAAAGQLHFNAVGTGIQTVFHDFLQRAGRPLHHLAGGDLVDQVVGQGGNTGHGRLGQTGESAHYIAKSAAVWRPCPS